jgi:hypothetical protein
MLGGKYCGDALEGDETRELPMTLLAGSPWKNT